MGIKCNKSSPVRNPTVNIVVMCYVRSVCVSGPEARLLLLPGPVFSGCLALHAVGLPCRQLCPLPRSQVRHLLLCASLLILLQNHHSKHISAFQGHFVWFPLKNRL